MESDKKVHENHCNTGEYEGSCKYGDADCPMLTKHQKEGPLPEGTVVTSTTDGGTIVGEICGIANELPVVGYMYIIKIISRGGLQWERYPYSCCVLPRTILHLADK